jgi:SAM-dependent methyltransferase
VNPGPKLWDDRYADAYTAYGTHPNDFLRAVARQIPNGPVLVLAAGEGRNAVYLAEIGYDVTAVDQSAVGMANATKLALSRGVAISTIVADLADFNMGTSQWAGIVSIWAHLPSKLRGHVHGEVATALRPGGVFILEAYSPAHLDLPGKGGPPVTEMLVELDDATQELDGLDFHLSQDARRYVSEGREHHGPSATTQLLGARPLSDRAQQGVE